MQYIVFFDQNGVKAAPIPQFETDWDKIRDETGVGADVSWPVIGLNSAENNAVNGTYPASPIFAGGSLEAWRLPEASEKVSKSLPNPKGWRKIADGLPKVIPLDVGAFDYLFLAYNREGGPQINVVAMDRASVQKFDPTKTKLQKGADAKYGVYPCEDITFVTAIKKPPEPPSHVSMEHFGWEPNGIVLRTDPEPGSFMWTPDTEDHVELTVKFKSELPILPPAVSDPTVIGQRYVFDGWDRNSLSNWLEGAVHQWSGGKDDPCSFDRESFVGVVAYYRLIQTKMPRVSGKKYKPGPVDKGCPFNDLGIFDAGGHFFFNLKELSEGNVIGRSEAGARAVEMHFSSSLSARIQTTASQLRSETNNKSFDAMATRLSQMLSEGRPR